MSSAAPRARTVHASSRAGAQPARFQCELTVAAAARRRTRKGAGHASCCCAPRAHNGQRSAACPHRAGCRPQTATCPAALRGERQERTKRARCLLQRLRGLLRLSGGRPSPANTLHARGRGELHWVVTRGRAPSDSTRCPQIVAFPTAAHARRNLKPVILQRSRAAAEAAEAMAATRRAAGARRATHSTRSCATARAATGTINPPVTPSTACPNVSLLRWHKGMPFCIRHL
jgi:hypothetical protein